MNVTIDPSTNRVAYGYDANGNQLHPDTQTLTYDYENRTASGLDYALNRYYNSNLGRLMSPDPYMASAGPGDPGSWNRYAYTPGDPVNGVDPLGLFVSTPPIDWSVFFPIIIGTPQGPGRPVRSDPQTDFPDCNPQGNSGIEMKLDWVYNNYDDAAAEAAKIQSDLGKTIDTNGLTTLLLQWSANESGYGQNPANVAENNFFGVQNKSNAAGLFGGTTVVCNRDGNPIPTNSTNACFAPTVGWRQELGSALGIASTKTGVTYLSAVETALGNGANMTQALQAIANNGWNGSPAYGSSITSGITIQSQIDCLKKNKDIP